MKEKKKVIVLIVSILGILILLGGASYALFTITVRGSKTHTIQSGKLSLIIDNEKNAISLNKTYPMEDKEGLLGSPTTFTLNNNGEKGLDYTIKLVEDEEAKSKCTGCKFIPLSMIRYEVVKGKEHQTPNNLTGSATALDRGYIASKNTINYELRLWLDSNSDNSAMDAVFYGKLSIEAIQSLEYVDGSGASRPELDEGMIPVIYDEANSSWEKANTSNEWYNYEKQNWANAVTIQKTPGDLIVDASNNRKHIDTKRFMVNEDRSLELDGIDDYLLLGKENYDFQSQITLAIRFRVNQSLLNGTHLLSNPENGGVAIDYRTSGGITFNVHNGTAYQQLASNVLVEVGKWYTAVATYDGVTQKIYIDGVLKGTKATTGTIKTSPAPFAIGASPAPRGINDASLAAMTVTDAYLYTDALSESEIASSFGENVKNPPSDHILIGLNDFQRVKNKDHYVSNSDKTITFDGVDDYFSLQHANFDFGNQISIVARFRYHGDPTSTAILGNAEGAGFELARSSKELYFIIHNGTSYQSVNSKVPAEIGKWYTIIGTYDGIAAKLYINGEFVGSTAITGNIKVSTAPLMLGCNPGPGEACTGAIAPVTISDAMIYTKPLTEEEVKTYYQGEITDYKKTDLLFYYNDFRSQTVREYYQQAKGNTSIPMSDINAMWVWIPRYEFTIGNMYGVQGYGGSTPSKATPGAIDIKFQKKTDALENGTAKYTGSTPGNWYTHPAFCFGTLTTADNRTTCDGDEVNGIWVGKFETGAPEADPCSTSPNVGNCNKNTLSPVSKPNISSWRYASLSTMFNAVLLNMNGSNGSAAYGFNATSGDSHMMKNMEWGAVAYLTQSKYGKYGNSMYTGTNKEIYINNYISATTDPRSTKTGCSAGEPSTAEAVGTCAYTYDKVTDRGSGTGSGGAGASTTGNVSGIYDMSGAGYEYVMGNFNGYSGYNSANHSGFAGPLGAGGSVTGVAFPEAKYYDKYTGTTGLKGDAMNADGTAGWYADDVYFVTSSSPWFYRGGGWANTTGAGVFYFSKNNGMMYNSVSCRLVRVLEV